MSSSRTRAIPPYASAKPGTQVLLGWANWQTQRGPKLATRIVVFRKEDVRLLVHEYEDVCGLLELGDAVPRIRGFRIWSQPLPVVKTKLVQYGWTVVSDIQRSEVSHAH